MDLSPFVHILDMVCGGSGVEEAGEVCGGGEAGKQRDEVAEREEEEGPGFRRRRRRRRRRRSHGF